MPVPTIDFETFSASGFIFADPSEKYPLGRWVPPAGAKTPGIGAVGAPAYAEHPSTEVLTCSYDLCDGRGIRRWRPGQPLPLDLFAHVAQPGAELEAYNAMFERLIVEKVCGPKYGWPSFPSAVWRCSMATALVAQRPAGLAALGEVLGLTEQKDKEGKRLINKFCIPQQPIVGLIDKRTGAVKRPDQPARRIFPHDDPEDFEKLCAYCDQDVRTEMAAAERMPPMEPHEVAAWQFTQDMNYRGLGVDREGLYACIDILGKVLDQYGQECEDLTGFKSTQLAKLIGWLAAHGVHTSSLDAENLKALLERDDIPVLARRVLELRALTGSASVKKTLAIKSRLSADNRLRDIVVHHGTRPGRPSGEGPQPLNLPKAGPKLSYCECGQPSKITPHCPWCGGMKRADARASWAPDMVQPVLDIMSLGSLDMVERYFGDAMTAIQGCVRGLFQADPGNVLVSTDYSSLQAVVAACMAGEQWRIDAFRRGDPIYLLGASKITGKPLQFYLDWYEQHGDHHLDRQRIGKVSELACFSPETQVLTDRGYIPIVQVGLNDLLWDGVEWVRHRGLVPKGPKRVIAVDGVRMTPNHLINLNGFWKAAKLVVSNGNYLSQALVTGSANLPSVTSSSARGAALRGSGSTVPAGRRSIEPTEATSCGGKQPVAANAPWRRLRKPAALIGGLIKRTIGHMPIFAPMMRTVADCLIGYRRASLAAVQETPRLMRGTMGCAAYAFIQNGRRIVGGFYDTFLRFLAGMFLRSNWIGSRLMGITNPATSGSSANRKICKTNGQSETCKPYSTFTSPCYDIAHAGPRNRFTIKTDSGHLIVHNCGFQGWINSYRAFGSDEPDDVIRKQILAWREASPAIVEMWGGQWRGPPWRRERQEYYGFEGMFVLAVRNPGQSFTYRGVTFCMSEPDCLVVRLPQIDGIRRALRYHEPRLMPSARARDEVSLSYMTYNTNPNYGARGWVRMPTWGGRLTENFVMGVEVDIQRFGARLLEAHGYPMVLGVYDEDVCEIRPDKPLTLGLPRVEGLDPHVQEIEHLLSIMPSEIADWPIKASGGWAGRRYRKG